MKVTHHIVAVVFLLLAIGTCVSRGNDSEGFRTTPHRRKVYSKYYDGAAWMAPKHLGMSVVVENERTHNPIFDGIRRALDPDDSFATAKVTVWLWNFDNRGRSVRILDVTPEVYPTTIPGKVINVAPRDRNGEVIGRIRIFDASRVIPIKVRYELNGKLWAVELLLNRRTKEEESRYFGADWNAPYPWRWVGDRRKQPGD